MNKKLNSSTIVKLDKGQNFVMGFQMEGVILKLGLWILIRAVF